MAGFVGVVREVAAIASFAHARALAESDGSACLIWACLGVALYRVSTSRPGILSEQRRSGLGFQPYSVFRRRGWRRSGFSGSRRGARD